MLISVCAPSSGENESPDFVDEPESCCLGTLIFNLSLFVLTDGVPDFLVLRTQYERSMQQNWAPGRRFKSFYGDGWYTGTVAERTVYDELAPDSPWQSLVVHWDGAADAPVEEEVLSPWDLDVLDEEQPASLGAPSASLPPATGADIEAGVSSADGAAGAEAAHTSTNEMTAAETLREPTQRAAEALGADLPHSVAAAANGQKTKVVDASVAATNGEAAAAAVAESDGTSADNASAAAAAAPAVDESAASTDVQDAHWSAAEQTRIAHGIAQVRGDSFGCNLDAWTSRKDTAN